MNTHGKKIVFVLSRVPYPLEKGDKLRAFHQLRVLYGHFSICLIAITDEPIHPKAEKNLLPYCDEFHVFPISRASIGFNIFRSLLNGDPLQVGYFFNKKACSEVSEIIDRFDPDVVYGQLLRTAEYLRKIKGPTKVLDYQDTFSKGIERRRDRSNGPMKWIFSLEYKRLIRYEQAVFTYFDHCTIISEQDRDALPFPEKEKVSVIPNGVDMDYFAPRQQKPDTDILFAGNMGYPPNVMACQFLARDVLPILNSSMPDIKMTFSGARPTTAVKILADKHVEITGWVDDMRSSYARTRIFVAPMMIGTGLQNKLLEAMSMGIPCITTALANNALGATPNEHILIAFSPLEFADAIKTLLENPQRAEELGKAGRAFIEDNYGWEAQTKGLVEILSGDHTSE